MRNQEPLLGQSNGAVAAETDKDRDLLGEVTRLQSELVSIGKAVHELGRWAQRVDAEGRAAAEAAAQQAEEGRRAQIATEAAKTAAVGKVITHIAAGVYGGLLGAVWARASAPKPTLMGLIKYKVRGFFAG